MGYGDGIERPFLDNQNHNPTCRVWSGYQFRFGCDCGAVALTPKVIPGFSSYEITPLGEITNLKTRNLLRVGNSRGTVSLMDDDGTKQSVNIIHIMNRTFLWP